MPQMRQIFKNNETHQTVFKKKAMQLTSLQKQPSSVSLVRFHPTKRYKWQYISIIYPGKCNTGCYEWRRFIPAEWFKRECIVARRGSIALLLPWEESQKPQFTHGMPEWNLISLRDSRFLIRLHGYLPLTTLDLSFTQFYFYIWTFLKNLQFW